MLNFHRIAARRLEEYIISTLWMNSHCYQKCTNHKNERDALCHNKDAALRKKHARRCMNDGYACQIQCWSSQPDFNHEVSLLGHDALKNYNLSLDLIHDLSYERFKKHGNVDLGLPMQNFLTSLLKGIEAPSEIRLPVCQSPRNTMGDFDDVNIHNHLSNHKHFPCHCGDWRSNETAEFQAAIGMGANSSYMKQQNTKVIDTFPLICPEVSLSPQ